MASGGISTMPRPATSGGFPIKHLPVIQHPNAARGELNQGALTVRGESRAGSRASSQYGLNNRQRTFVSMDTERLTLGLDRGGLSAVRQHHGRARTTSMLDLTRPHSSLTEPGYRTLRGKYQKPVEEQPKFEVDDLESLIQERLKTGYHGLKHLFRSNDPNGEGNVSKDALLTILYNLIGYIPREQFNTLLKRVGLEKRPTIPFDIFVSCFKGNETVQKAWMSPTQQMYMSGGQDNLRSTSFIFRDGHISGTFCFSVLRQKAKSRSFKIQDFLPRCCLEPDGRVVPPQLRELLEKLDIVISDEEFDKLWFRYDRDSVGAVKTTQFLKMLGLDEQGNYCSIPIPGIRTKAVVKEKKDDGKQNEKQDGKEKHSRKEDSRPKMPEEETKMDSEGKRQDQARKLLKSTRRMHKRAAPRLEKVIDCLHYKFEESYNSLLMGMQCFDFLGDGMISRIDLKHVLEAFGLKITCTDLELFLSRCGIRTMRGEIAYKDFLMKFWNKSESGLLNRIATNPNHVFSQDRELPGSCETLTGEQLEAKLVEFIHGDFLRLIGNLKESDKYSIGVVTQYEFKHAVEKRLGYQISDGQWEELKATVQLDKDGLVPYPKFLQMFNIVPGAWNKKEMSGFLVRQVSQAEPCPTVDKLKQKSKEMHEDRKRKIEAEDKKNGNNSTQTWKKKLQEIQQGREKQQSRSTQQLNDLLREFFQTKFHDFDSSFKKFDRRMTNRIFRHNFQDLLGECGFQITREESERVWHSMTLAADGMMHFSALISYFKDDACQPNVLDTSENKESKNEKEAKQSSEPDKSKAKAPQEDERKSCCHVLLERIRPQVIEHWDLLKHQLRLKDDIGSATLRFAEMKDVLTSLHMNLDDDEMQRLLQKFDLKKNGKFHYLDFLKSYTCGGGDSNKEKKDDQVPQHSMTLDYKLRQKQQVTSATSWQVEHPTLAQVIEHVRTKLLKDWKTLRRAFKKLDSSHSGYLSVEDFQCALTQCGLAVEGEDLYQILTQFDSNMDGRVSYEEFITQMLGTV